MYFRINPLEIIKNQIIKLSFVKKIAKRYHNTGINDEDKEVLLRFSELVSIVNKYSVQRNACVEFGPGQTIGILRKLKKHLFQRVCAVDIEQYISSSLFDSVGVDYIDYSSIFKVRNKSIDFVYGYDVLEHVRDPKLFLKEVHRILSDRGIAYFSWDLRDHLNLDLESMWFDMHKYSSLIWGWQMSNRSAYVNRLTKDMWLELFDSVNFDFLLLESYTSEKSSNYMKDKYGIVIDPTYRISGLLQKKIVVNDSVNG